MRLAVMKRTSGTRAQPQATKGTNTTPGTTRQSATIPKRLRLSMAAEPGYTPCAGANPVQGDVARHHAGVDAQRHEPHGHDVVHHDIRANNDCEIFMRER